MNSIEKLLETIPVTITKEIEITCFSCGTKYKRKCRYELQIKLSKHEARMGVMKRRYHIFYECGAFGYGDSDRYIGNPCGLGFLTLEEAIKDLKGYLINELH